MRPHYFEMIAEHFPALEASTTARFAGRVNPERGYVEGLESRVERIRARHGFREEGHRTAPAAPVSRGRSPASAPDQMRLAI